MMSRVSFMLGSLQVLNGFPLTSVGPISFIVWNYTPGRKGEVG